jgi:ADP-ribose pyrophosphatase
MSEKVNFTILKHDILFEGRVLNLYKDLIQYDDGQNDSREVVEHYGGSTVLAVTDNSLILVKQYRHPLKQFVYELPAGKLNLNEDPLNCAKRELKEETGYTATNWEKIISFHTTPGYSSEKLHIYLATDLTKGEQELELGERNLEVIVVDFIEALKMIKNEEITDSKTIIGILLGQELLLKQRSCHQTGGLIPSLIEIKSTGTENPNGEGAKVGSS